MALFVTVTGLVNDIVRGTVAQTQANVTVNGVQASVSNRSYVAENVPLTPGANTLTVAASDAVGNTETKSIQVNFQVLSGPRILLVSGQGQRAQIRQAVSQPLTVKLVDGTGAPVPSKQVVFRAIQGDGKVGQGTAQDKQAVVVTSDAQGLASTIFTLGSRAGAGNQRVRARAVGFGSEVIFHASADPKPGDKISVIAGNNQRGAVRNPLPAPFVAAVTDEGGNLIEGAQVEFRVFQGSGVFQNGQTTYLTTTDSDGRATAMLTLGPEVGLDAQRATAGLVGTDAVAGFTTSGLQPGDPGQTKVTGVVLDNQDAPVPGVALRIEGTTRQAQSDAQGQFTIEQVPVGPVRLLVDGSTTTRPGEWPTLSFDIVTVAGADNSLPAPIYILPLNTQSAAVVGNQDVTLTLPEVPGFALKVKAGSVTFPDGSKTGNLSVTVVNSDKVPMPPPNGMQPQFIVTIQPAGARFEPPAELTLPNVDAHSPGAEVEMYSYDHDLEEFVTIGWGTVSQDGGVIKSNPGVGVVKAGWHCGSQPTGQGCALNCGPCHKPQGCACVIDEVLDNDCRQRATAYENYTINLGPANARALFGEALTCVGKEMCNIADKVEDCEWLFCLNKQLFDRWTAHNTSCWRATELACDLEAQVLQQIGGSDAAQIGCATRQLFCHNAVDMKASLEVCGCGTNDDWETIRGVVGACAFKITGSRFAEFATGSLTDTLIQARKFLTNCQ